MTARTAPARPSLLPATLATIVALAILIALGVWQLHRRDWKLGILAAIDRAESGPPIPLVGMATPAPFTKVSVTGTMLPQKALYGVDVREQLGGPPREGAHLIGILTRPSQKPVVVDIGWVPTDNGAPDPRSNQAQGPATLVGYVRPPEHPGWLSAADDPAHRQFYTLDPAAIAASLGVRDVAPFTVVALGQDASAGAPMPVDALPRPPNNHLQYAFTWFGLAATLVGVFVAWVRSQRSVSKRWVE